jgi:hypothetical protein
MAGSNPRYTPTVRPLPAHNPPCSLPDPFLIPPCYLPVTSLSFLAGLTSFSLREKEANYHTPTPVLASQGEGYGIKEKG